MSAEPSLLPREILDALDRGVGVITANARSARALRRAFAERKERAGNRSWLAPLINDWAAWTQALYAELCKQSDDELPLLLTSLQEELLWKRVQRNEADQVVSPERLALLAQSAYALLGTYEAHSNRRAPWAATHEDAERFLEWANAFDEACEDLGVLPRASLEKLLRAHAAELAVPQEILLLGFDRLTPSQQRLLSALEESGIGISHAPAAPLAPLRRVYSAADDAAELDACARWIREQLEQQPSMRIGVLVPQLQGARAEIDRVFRRVLTPESARRASGGMVPYEFSLGAPLAHVPAVAAALLLLRLATGSIDGAEFSSLLTGGFLAEGPEDEQSLAYADTRIRRAGLLTTEVELATLLRRLREKPTLVPPGLLQRLRAAEQWARVLPFSASYSIWAEKTSEALALLGWPGYRELSSVAFQAHNRWNTLLDDASLLSFSGDRIGFRDFIRDLASFAHGALFAAESRKAPVQILGAAEASGQYFDAVWFLQVTESRWPQSGRLHPLLAPELQRDAAMPHSTSAADLELAREQMRRILCSAPIVTFSYAEQSSGVASRPSPMLAEVGTPVTRLRTTSPVRPGTRLVRRQEDTASIPWDVARVAGGSEVLRRQAICAFQSFAANRLGAEPLEPEQWGLDARKRANLLHGALEQLWSTEPVKSGSMRLHSQEDLARAIGDGSIEDCLDHAITAAFRDEIGRAGGDSWLLSHLALEQQRLRTRLLFWLEIEQDRAPFRVRQLEVSLANARVGALLLNLRADRVDEVVDGEATGQLLIDYKTADRVMTALWQGARPEEPQLPIYALYGGIEHVVGLAFAQLRPAKTRLHGLARDPAAQLGTPAMRKDPECYTLTDAMLGEWDHALHALAADFLRGDAAINPLRGKDTCGQCGLYSICRVRAQVGMLAIEQETADGE